MVGLDFNIVAHRITAQDARPVHRYREDATTATLETRRKLASFRETGFAHVDAASRNAIRAALKASGVSQNMP